MMNKSALFLNAGSRGELEDPVGDVTFYKGDQTSTRPLAGSYDTGWLSQISAATFEAKSSVIDEEGSGSGAVIEVISESTVDDDFRNDGDGSWEYRYITYGYLTGYRVIDPGKGYKKPKVTVQIRFIRKWLPSTEWQDCGWYFYPEMK